MYLGQYQQTNSHDQMILYSKDITNLSANTRHDVTIFEVGGMV